MKTNFIYYVLIALLFGGIGYLCSDSFIVLGVVALVTLLYFFLFFHKRITNYFEKTKRFSSCYTFINNFIVSLSVKLSISGALETVVNSMDQGFLDEYAGIQHLNDDEKLQYLKKYYHFHIYELFLNVVTLFEERGGNVLDMSTYLLEESRNQEEYTIQTKSMAIKKIVEFVSLWFFAILILVMIRFALSDFFTIIASQIMYQVMVIVIFLFIIFSVEMFSRRAFSVEIKGWENE